ncbi:MAG: DMT family transporter [Pseudomonadota bacterium]
MTDASNTNPYPQQHLRGWRLLAATALALIAFAANSILCRAALDDGADAIGFTLVRVLAGGITLMVLVASRWRLALALFDPYAVAALCVYMFGFALAYRALDTGLGALLLFGTVQLTMFAAAVLGGERIRPRALFGAIAAFAGLVGLVWPTQGSAEQTAALGAAGSMVAAGVGWGLYSLRGRGARDPLLATAANFLYAAPVAVLAAFYAGITQNLSGAGIEGLLPGGRQLVLALASGALASGLGYALWYRVLPDLRVAQAATVQVLVPAVAAWGGVLFVDETITLALLLWGSLILSGVALVMWPASARTTGRASD